MCLFPLHHNDMFLFQLHQWYVFVKLLFLMFKNNLHIIYMICMFFVNTISISWNTGYIYIFLKHFLKYWIFDFWTKLKISIFLRCRREIHKIWIFVYIIFSFVCCNFPFCLRNFCVIYFFKYLLIKFSWFNPECITLCKLWIYYIENGWLTFVINKLKYKFCMQNMFCKSIGK